MENENDERIISDGTAKKSDPNNLPIPPGERKALLSSLDAAEGIIKNDTDRETAVLFDQAGRGVFVKRASGTRIDVRSEIIKAGERAVGATFTHNHPRSTSFSYEDAITGCWAKFGEIRAVSALYKYSLRAVEGNLSDEISEAVSRRYAEMIALARREAGNPAHYPAYDDYDREATHILWERLAPEAGLVYHREDQKKPRITLP